MLTGEANLIQFSAVKTNFDPGPEHVSVHRFDVGFADLLVRQKRSHAQGVLFWPTSEADLI